jgi:hypothetical protein
MKTTVGLVLMSAVLFASTAHAQVPTWSDAQAEVWAVVQQSWKDDVAENGKWPGEYAHEKYMTWGDSHPAPRDRDMYTKWVRMNEEANDTFWYEITPLAIIVEGETAVVMYSSLVGQESKNGERSFSSSSFVEMLRQDGENWQLLASTSFTPDYNN